MSLILDALNRSREDTNPMPGLATHHRVELVSADRRQYLLWVALAVAVVVIAWLIMELYSPAPLAAPEVAMQDAELTRQNFETVEEVADPQQLNNELAVVAPVVEATDSVIETASDLGDAGTDVVQEFPAVKAPAATVTSSSAVKNDAVAKLYENPQALDEQAAAARPAPQGSTQGAVGRQGMDSAGARAKGEPIDVDKILRMAREEAENASLGDHPVPFLIDLSQQIKDSIPSVYYLRHDYSSNTGQSSVVLNSKTLKVGGSPASGMKIEEILPDSVVLNYQGTQFRLRALNSWINL